MSGGNKQTTTQQTTPAGAAQPLLNHGMALTQGLLSGNKLAPYVGMGATTKSGLTDLLNASRSYRPSLVQALGSTREYAGGQNKIGTDGQQQVFGAAMGPGFSEQNLAGIARGDLIGREDPDFERLISGASEKAQTAARMAAGSMGRYGGDFAQDSVARAVGDTEAGYRYQHMNTERDRMLQANSLMDQFRQAGLGLGLNAANSRSSIEGANADRQLGAAANIPGLYEASLSPSRLKTEIGGMYDEDAQNRANVPTNNLQTLMSILGVASPYATTTATTKGPNNTASQLFGGGLGLASLLFG